MSNQIEDPVPATAEPPKPPVVWFFLYDGLEILVRLRWRHRGMSNYEVIGLAGEPVPIEEPVDYYAVSESLSPRAAAQWPVPEEVVNAIKHMCDVGVQELEVPVGEPPESKSLRMTFATSVPI